MGTVGSGAVWGRTRVPFPASLAAAAPSPAQQGPCLRFCFSQGRATTGDVRVHLFQTEVFWSSFGFTGKSCVPGRQVDAFSRTELRAPVRFTPPHPPVSPQCPFPVPGPHPGRHVTFTHSGSLVSSWPFLALSLVLMAILSAGRYFAERPGNCRHILPESTPVGRGPPFPTVMFAQGLF